MFTSWICKRHSLCISPLAWTYRVLRASGGKPPVREWARFAAVARTRLSVHILNLFWRYIHTSCIGRTTAMMLLVNVMWCDALPSSAGRRTFISILAVQIPERLWTPIRTRGWPAIVLGARLHGTHGGQPSRHAWLKAFAGCGHCAANGTAAFLLQVISSPPWRSWRSEARRRHQWSCYESAEMAGHKLESRNVAFRNWPRAWMTAKRRPKLSFLISIQPLREKQ